MSAQKYWVWLSTAGLSVKNKWRLLEHFGDAGAVYQASEDAYDCLPFLSPLERKALRQRELGSAETILESCRREGIRLITVKDADYPRRLKNIPDPPVALYVKGSLPELDSHAAIAVIGTRKASSYGLKMARQLSYELARGGALLLSLVGGPVDQAALKGALLGDGCCVGVLAGFSDGESRLQEDILARGALVSEVPPGIPVQKCHFRDRNRIAAGLSVGVLVVEAPERSGTRLFCLDAVEQGKEIFALPGNADAENSVGTLTLIKEGAKLVTCGADVLEEFQLLFPDKIRLTPPGPLPEEREEKDLLSQRPASAAKAIDKPADRGYIDLKEQLSGLSEDQLQILTAIEVPSSHIDDVIAKTGFGAAKVLAQLTVLEIKGFVRRVPGRRISVNIAKK